ncbi:MAG: MarR family transcriptional regulator, partial [Streptomycetaceae bacterium]|nr:MarR family transcriptional regulator [Streptomycetaceae bacterium]
PDMAAAIEDWLGASARGWAAALGGLTADQRRTVVQALLDYENALERDRPGTS